MRLCANLLLMAVPLHLCFGEVVPIPPTMENPSLRSAPSAGAGAREDARSLRELNSAAGRGNLPESVSGFAGRVMPGQASTNVAGTAALERLKTVALEAEKSGEQVSKDFEEAAARGKKLNGKRLSKEDIELMSYVTSRVSKREHGQKPS
uniref:RxLR effector candidate protein n=2 Tax=Hyaloperonospora arabidopsidis (strain Emoy2) TaxID=559515 RepID=M4BE54_HYAAE